MNLFEWPSGLRRCSIVNGWHMVVRIRFLLGEDFFATLNFKVFARAFSEKRYRKESVENSFMHLHEYIINDKMYSVRWMLYSCPTCVLCCYTKNIGAWK